MEHSPRYSHDDSEKIDICSIDGYVQLIANIFAGNEKLIPVVRNFMYEVLDKDKINSFAWEEEYKLSEEDCRDRFVTIDSTKEFLEQHKKADLSLESPKATKTSELPEWIQAYPKEVISAMGGASLFKKIIQARGEESAKEIISALAGGIMEEKESDSNDD